MIFSYNYVLLGIFVLLSFFLAVILSIISLFLSYNFFFSNIELGTSYECGFLPFSDSRMKFDVHFYLIAILFVIFDIEVCLLLPWAVCFNFLNFFSFFFMICFFVILGLGFFVEWNFGALDLNYE